MFILTAKVPRCRVLLPVVLAVSALALLCILLRSGARSESAPLRANTDEARIAYLASFGWEAVPEPIESVRLTLPEELVEPYRSYNELQTKQGFDLTPYLGKTLERFSYTVTNHPAHPQGCQADLYVFDGIVVAGDVVCTGENGFISTLDYPAAQ